MSLKKSWVQDAKESEVGKLISKISLRTGTQNPPGSKYVTGPSKSEVSDEVGIYFQDPTAT